MTTTIDRISELIRVGNTDEARAALAAGSGDALEGDRKRLYDGMILERDGRWDEAAAVYEAVMNDDPSNAEAAFRLAYLADLRGDDELAIELYESMTSGGPAYVSALLNLAILYEDQGRDEDALACIDLVLEEHPNHERARLFQRDVAASMDMYYDEDRERSREKRNAILETPISDFELSIRSQNCLKQMDIFTLGDLLKTTASELLSYKNFGETSLHEIETMLSQKGLRLGQLLEEKEPDVSRLMTPQGADPAQAGLLWRSVAELELSVRARKCLMRLGVSTIGELVSRSEPDLLSIKNFGMTSLAEIKRRLAELNLSLKT